MSEAEFLSQFITENKREKIEKVLSERTRQLTLVLEDIFQPHNASATLRTSEILGIQDIHIIEGRNKYEVNPDVVLGSSKWINLIRYREAEQNTIHCFQKLKSQGYQILAATPHHHSIGLDDIDLGQKTALAFGTELTGLSQDALDHADGYLSLPMFGFTQSFNISVTVGIVFFYLMKKLRESQKHWHLKDIEKEELRLCWYKRILGKRALPLEQEYQRILKG